MLDPVGALSRSNNVGGGAMEGNGRKEGSCHLLSRILGVGIGLAFWGGVSFSSGLSIFCLADCLFHLLIFVVAV